MQKLIGTLFVVAASSAVACPQLAGTYVCEGMSGHMTITQQDCTQVTLDHVVSAESGYLQSYTTDGLTHSTRRGTSPGYEWTNYVTAAYDADELVIVTSHEFEHAERNQCSWEVQKLSLDAEKNLVISRKSSSGYGAEVVSTQALCNPTL